MEGPSLFLAAEQLQPFIKETVIQLEGNTRIEKERLYAKKILDIFSWGKHLVFQFDTFALRVHFMLFGSFEAVIKNKKVTGDYDRSGRPIRLAIICKKGRINLFACSLKFIELPNAKESYDFTMDIMSEKWDEKAALKKIQLLPNIEIADVLLDQTIFAGVGNIIKNEVLYLEKIQPLTKAEELSLKKLKSLIKQAREFSHQFYLWRKDFSLKKHLTIYRKNKCPSCGLPVVRKKTGKHERLSYFCPNCQK